MSGKIIQNQGRSSGLIKAPASGSASTLAASTTVGDASAEDTLIVFDGNALDFRLGIDDGTDTLEIGKGNAHGTTTHMTFDTNGIISMPLQPAASVHLSSTQTIATGTWTKLALASELYDKNNDFDSSTKYRFTAPVDGIYLVNLNVAFALTAGNDAGGAIYLNGAENNLRIDVPGRSGGHFNINVVAMLDLDATDYVEFFAYHSEGSDDTITGSAPRTFAMIHKLA